jgi:hypothetical protein
VVVATAVRAAAVVLVTAGVVSTGIGAPVRAAGGVVETM